MRLSLAYAPPYDWEAMLGFLAARAVVGMETVVDGVYSRSIGLKGLHGSVSIWNGAGDALEVELDFPDPVARLLALHGVGEWTAQYIALRQLRDLDGFPSGDVGLMRALEVLEGERPTAPELSLRAEAWRPYRGYAAQLLWTSLSRAD
ncbi:DNA-3-methyladenine glycosylase 2 [Pseudomonas sp. NPDC087690]|uniref:DNA-3-methyladenine glycosylase 2 n=1 Tax=Pseudomonas sp. NPDC087690 TaxID=3364446 RepID=UPI003806A97C